MTYVILLAKYGLGELNRWYMYYVSVLKNILTSIWTCYKKLDIIRIYHECEGGIEESVSRITDWHHDCRVMLSYDKRLS